MADNQQQLWRYPEVAAHRGISVRTARSPKSRTRSAPGVTSAPDRPRWRPTTFRGLTAPRTGIPQRPSRHCSSPD
jgi:hypothetical protein